MDQIETADLPRRLVSSVARAAEVLALFARSEQPDLGVTEIANELDLAKAVVHRILATLTACGFVESPGESRRYRLGPMSLSLGLAYLERLDVRALARPVIQDLSTRTNETATLSLRSGDERMYVDQVTPNREVKMTVVLGRAFPLHAGSSSKAFLAFLSEETRTDYLERRQLTALTDRTHTDAATLAHDLETIRSRGYAISFGERQAGAASVAAPVLNHEGLPEAVISVCGPLERFREQVELVATPLLEATLKLSEQFGYRPAVTR